MKKTLSTLAAALAAIPAFADSSVNRIEAPAILQATDEAPIKSLGTITVTGGQPTSLPTQIPTTIEGITGKQVEDTINATDAEDALKYLPSLNVRKRYIGDYDHAVLASRASGTQNSARSLVYADGVPLSNLLGNGASFTPRWGMVTPEEIERVDVLYGPFSAAYSGNSVGAVVDYVTRMPRQFEAHVKLAAFTQRYEQYGTDDRYSGGQASASLGNRSGDFSWWFNVNRLDNVSHPIAFAQKGLSTTLAGGNDVVVSGAVPDRDTRNLPRFVLGDTNRIETTQDHAKFKFAYDFSPTVRASYVFGLWQNDAHRTAETYLRDANGNPFYGAPGNNTVNIGGNRYTLNENDFSHSVGDLEHHLHGLSVKSNSRGVWDWEIAASLYDYATDTVRASTGFQPAAANGGKGQITDQNGTGWNTLALKGIWRPAGLAGAHLVDFGYQRESYQLETLVSSITGNWRRDAPGARKSAFEGETRLQSVYAQDTWRFAADWRATLGARLERWEAFDGAISDATSTLAFAAREETGVSPKAALAYQLTPEWVMKASLGRAIRYPTVSELYQGSISVNSVVNNDPNLKPEKSWTTELTAERDLGNGVLRNTFFFEDTEDGLYSQTNVNAQNTSVSTIQNVEKIRTFGAEIAYQAMDVGIAGLDLTSSLTYAHSEIVENDNFPASEGKWQPRVPRWRANFLASYKPDAHWVYSFGARYSGKQFGQLDNSDVNGDTYFGVSDFFVTDVRVRYKVNKNWSASVGIDNLNDAKYWAFHPYPQRTFLAELKYDL